MAGFVNFSTDDFLGLNRKFRTYEARNTHLNDDALSEWCTVISSLKRIFKSNILLFPDESSVHCLLLQNLVTSHDFIVMDELANPNLKIAVKHLNNLGIKSRTISLDNLEKLTKIITERSKINGKVWFVGQSIYPTPGKFSQLTVLNHLLEKYKNLYLILEDSYGLGLFGSLGEGIVYSTFQNLQRVVIVAALTKGFGAGNGAVAVSGIESSFFKEDFNTQGWTVQNLNQIFEISNLINNNEIVALQEQLMKKIKFFQKLIQDNLFYENDPALPLCFIPVRLPQMCHVICSNLLKEGLYVSSAIYPHTSMEHPGIKINITIDHTENDLKKLAVAFKDCYSIAFNKYKTVTSNLKTNLT